MSSTASAPAPVHTPHTPIRRVVVLALILAALV